MKTAIKRSNGKFQTDGFARRGRRRVGKTTTGYSNIGFKPDDLNRLNEVGRDIARRTGMAVTARQVVMFLATHYLKER